MRKIAIIVISGMVSIVAIPILLSTYVQTKYDYLVPMTEAMIAFATLLLVLATAFRFLLNVEKSITNNLTNMF